MKLRIILLILCALPAGAVDWLPITCQARQTVGMHQYAGDVDETYMPAVFAEQMFDLRENALFMRHLLGGPGEAEATERGVPARPGARFDSMSR